MSADADTQVTFIPRAKRHKSKKKKRNFFVIILLMIVVGAVISKNISLKQSTMLPTSNVEQLVRVLEQKQVNRFENRFQVSDVSQETSRDEEIEQLNTIQEENNLVEVLEEQSTEINEIETLTPLNKITADYVLGHKVEKNETLFSITMLYYSSSKYQSKVQEYNGIVNPEKEVMEGITLQIPDPHYEVVHKVDRGETFLSISKMYYGTDEYAGSIAKYNEHTNPNHLTYGTVIQIPNPSVLQKNVPIYMAIPEYDPPFDVVISKKTNQLTVYSENKPIKTFSVGTGKDSSLTPEGKFQLVNKLKDPWYRAKEISGGDPNNPLGSHWLGLNVPGTDGTVYGIHGTNDPSSIGKHVSLGCVRLLNADVEWLYNNLPLETSITIQ